MYISQHLKHWEYLNDKNNIYLVNNKYSKSIIHMQSFVAPVDVKFPIALAIVALLISMESRSLPFDLFDSSERESKAASSLALISIRCASIHAFSKPSNSLRLDIEISSPDDETWSSEGNMKPSILATEDAPTDPIISSKFSTTVSMFEALDILTERTLPSSKLDANFDTIASSKSLVSSSPSLFKLSTTLLTGSGIPIKEEISSDSIRDKFPSPECGCLMAVNDCANVRNSNSDGDSLINFASLRTDFRPRLAASIDSCTSSNVWITISSVKGVFTIFSIGCCAFLISKSGSVGLSILSAETITSCSSKSFLVSEL
uniref:Uncharacterized protein n=1 Tax=Glossina brevipalpis TaxID=37001 RepID=A0A1A9X0Y6_9MUSC